VAQHSMWLTGKFTGDNVKNVEWECGVCGVRIPDREDGVRHIRTEHTEGTLFPHLNKTGRELAQLHFYADAAERLAKALVHMTDKHFCKGMGAKPVYVSPNIVSERALTPFPDNETLFKVVKNLLIDIRHKVEQKGGYISFTNSASGGRFLRTEREIQVTLEDWLRPKCEYLGLDLTREGETGRGLIDFRFSVGNDIGCLLEVKLFGNPKLEHGLMIQLPTHLQAQRLRFGIYVPIAADSSSYEGKLTELRKQVDRLHDVYDLEIELIDIRAWKPASASRTGRLDDPARYKPCL
jgi:hypothetical protein